MHLQPLFTSLLPKTRSHFAPDDSNLKSNRQKQWRKPTKLPRKILNEIVNICRLENVISDPPPYKTSPLSLSTG